ncbi:nucleoside deaminase [Limnobacter humi]|uniref:Nucleoside deaminase n=1 Tax=Limnobacter humi TaxID=1778671 RepID=A0ABT1WEN6_9BURK|nr:nucleoside deaminase [Limnobacter humi]MCQ8895969.1 nucleoside deaminase [Limnobacter humi]
MVLGTRPLNKFVLKQHQHNAVDERFMHEALAQARLAASEGEVPIGAVLVCDNAVLGRGRNAPIRLNNPCAHAELQAIQEACQHSANYRLGSAATLYVTLQPCLMCLGAILHARIGRVVVGSPQSRFHDNLAQTLSLFDDSEAWHGCRFETGCMEAASTDLLSAFFKAKRQGRETTLRQLKQLADLPNVNKDTVVLLNQLGLHSGGDFLKPDLAQQTRRLRELVLTLKAQGNRIQAAVIDSLCDYLDGEPVRSWKDYV